MIETYDAEQASAAQEWYCEKNGYPRFAPTWRDGYACPYCKQNIYREGGISVGQASIALITGCPFCHASYCD